MSLSRGIARALGEDVTGLTYSTTATGNVFDEFLPDDPDVAVAVYSVGGSEADSLLPFDSPSVQVVVRGDTAPQTGIDLWYLIYDYLHAKRNTTLPDGTYLVSCLVTQSAPITLDPDEQGRHQFSMNCRCEIQRTSDHRP